MSKRQLSILIASLFAAAPALAQTSDPFLSTGQVTAGGIWSDASGTNDESKFGEYRDLSNGLLSNIGITGRNSKSWVDAFAENLGRDDMYLNIRGGMYGVFKARAYSNWLPHEFLNNGLTPFTGSGGNVLTTTFPRPDAASWQTVNLGYQRKDTGGYFEWQQQSPWYFRVDGNQIKFEGTKPGSGSNGTSPGQGFTDLAIPVQTEANNVSFEGGYTTKTMTFTASYLASNFGNKNETLAWTNPYFTNGLDRSYLPPDNDYQRFALNGVIRALPLNSTLAARYTWDETKSSVDIVSQVLGGAAGAPSIINVQPDTNQFNGKETRQTFTLGWSGTPVADLDTRAYYNWQKMKNEGTDVTFCPSGAASCDGTFENELWHYDKNNLGIDAYWRINKANRLGAGYDWYELKQNRLDFEKTTTDTFFIEWKNTSIETLSARIKYQYQQRRGDYLLSEEGANANQAAFLERYTRFFDLANVDQNKVKLTIDWAPADAIGVAFEYQYKKNDYKDTTYGRKNDTRNEFFANLTYGAIDSWRVTLFGDYEDVKYDSDHRYVSSPAIATAPDGSVICAAAAIYQNCFDPNASPTTGSYNWSSTLKNNNWVIGVGVDVPVGDKLMLTGSVLYEQVDGSSDMSSQNNYGNPLPFSNYPNTTTTALNLKGTYRFDRNWSATLGYAYQKYDYSDDAFAGYLNSVPSISTAGVNNEAQRSYLNGYNAFQSYDANIVYLLGTYKF